MISRAAEALGYDQHYLCEKEPFQRRVLVKRFPGAEIAPDVEHLDATAVRGQVDLLHGGSPCQGFSVAGLGEALEDPRSRLIFELLRVVGECQPRIVLIENVSVLRSRGLSVVVDALARMDYLCWWDCVPALAVGAPHLRDRVWVTAVRADEMPDLDGRPFKTATTAFPRAGAITRRRGLIEMEPVATIKACKEAMGAVKQPDGTTWLTRLDSPLFPTPSAVSYGSNVGGAAVRPDRPRHSLEHMARHMLWPTPRASPNELRTLSSAPSHGNGHGLVLAGVVCDIERDEGRVVPPTSGSAGALSAAWVEWLMGMPIGLTDPNLDNDDLVQLDWSSEHGLPRVLEGVPDRKDRLICCGNACLAQIAYLRIAQAHELLGIAQNTEVVTYG